MKYIGCTMNITINIHRKDVYREDAIPATRHLNETRSENAPSQPGELTIIVSWSLRLSFGREERRKKRKRKKRRKVFS